MELASKLGNAVAGLTCQHQLSALIVFNVCALVHGCSFPGPSVPACCPMPGMLVPLQLGVALAGGSNRPLQPHAVDHSSMQWVTAACTLHRVSQHLPIAGRAFPTPAALWLGADGTEAVHGWGGSVAAG